MKKSSLVLLMAFAMLQLGSAGDSQAPNPSSLLQNPQTAYDRIIVT